MSRRLADVQGAFAAALIDPGLPVPEGVLGRNGTPDARRFAVYRNNMMVGLIDALSSRFPVTGRLVGEGFFRAMARAYGARHKPHSPLLMTYGDDFPDFIDGFEPAVEVPYLADVARLEVAWSHAYHAADAPPLWFEALTNPSPQDLVRARVALHPAVRLVRSPHPIATLWIAHQAKGDVVVPEGWEAEDVLVVRPEADVLMHRLPPGGYSFVAALIVGATVDEAAEAGLADAPDFDLGRNVAGLFTAGAIIGLHLRGGV